MRGLPEIDRANVRVGADLLRRALGEHRAAHQHGDLLGEAEHQVHVVIDDQHADAFRQRVDGVEDDVALGARHAGRRLVEQQHLGLQSERDGQLDQPLAAIGQFRNGLVGDVGELEPRQQLHRLVDHVAARARGRDHVRRGADALGDRHIDVLQHREAAEQPVDLEGAGDAELDPFGLLDLRDVLALEQHLAGARRQHAGEQVDEGGLAGAVRADQRVPRALLQREGDVARGARARRSSC